MHERYPRSDCSGSFFRNYSASISHKTSGITTRALEQLFGACSCRNILGTEAEKSVQFMTVLGLSRDVETLKIRVAAPPCHSLAGRQTSLQVLLITTL